MSEMGTIVAFAGLGSLLNFSQTSRHLLVGPISTIFGLLTIPAGISLLWRISVDFGWWTIAIFIVIATLNGIYTAFHGRKFGSFAALYAMQPILGAIFSITAVLSWFL